MADEEKPEDEQEEGGSGKKKKLIILIAAVVVLLLLAAGGTFFALKMFSGAEEEMLEAELIEEETENEPAVDGPAIYYPLKPAIVVNFNARGRQRFLQTELTLQIRDEEVVAAVETHMPQIRNSLILLLGGQIYEELQTAEGKDALRAQALEELQAIMEEELGRKGIEQVLLTSFVMQ